MLERFIEQKKAITLYCITRNQANAKNPTENQWQLAEMLVCILKHFESTTKDMSKETACISEIIPFIYAMEKFLDYACDTATEIKTVVDELKKDFNCRFQKYKDTHESLNEKLKNHNIIEILHLEFYPRGSGSDSEESLSSFSESKIHQSDSDFDGHGSPLKKKKLMSMDIYSLFHQIGANEYALQNSENSDGRRKKKKNTSSMGKTLTVKEKCTDEVNFYLSLPILPKNECPYKWWSAYRYTFSDKDTYKLNLSKFSKKVLCAPPSSVKSERLFSTSGNIFEAKRNRLLPEHGEQIAFLNCNMPAFIE
ncbi:zinc finger BED domain-containing protein 4-like [Hydra vulgaris]|uniref:zinc finger BED domain-containing protein 4-like n=1 Tax=Hydra vulgaris TaxID=6087 RepID=UPI0032EA73A2